MHAKPVKFLLPFLLSAMAAVAASPVGTVTSAGPVKLSGVRLPVAHVPSWPIALGDEIVTNEHPAVLLLGDRSRIAVGKNARVLVKGVRGKIEVWLMKGAIQYELPPRSRTKLRIGDQPLLEPSTLKGELSADENGMLIPPRARSIEDPDFIPPRTRPPDTPEPPPLLPPRSPSSQCGAEVQALPPRTRCG